MVCSSTAGVVDGQANQQTHVSYQNPANLAGQGSPYVAQQATVPPAAQETLGSNAQQLRNSAQGTAKSAQDTAGSYARQTKDGVQGTAQSAQDTAGSYAQQAKDTVTGTDSSDFTSWLCSISPSDCSGMRQARADQFMKFIIGF